MTSKVWVPQGSRDPGFTPGKKNKIVIEISDVNPSKREIQVIPQSDIPIEEPSDMRPTTPAEEVAMAALWFIGQYFTEKSPDTNPNEGMVIDTEDIRKMKDGGIFSN